MKVYLLFLLFLFSHNANAQTCFSYDAAGNRLLRQVCLLDFSLQSSPENQVLPIEHSLSNVLVMPNPSSGLIQIRADEYEMGTPLTIFDQSGRVLLHSKLSPDIIDLSEQASGVYFIVLSAPGRRNRTIKFEIVKD